jgi:hypothetical protein
MYYINTTLCYIVLGYGHFVEYVAGIKNVLQVDHHLAFLPNAMLHDVAFSCNSLMQVFFKSTIY